MFGWWYIVFGLIFLVTISIVFNKVSNKIMLKRQEKITELSYQENTRQITWTEQKEREKEIDKHDFWHWYYYNEVI